MRIAIFGLGSIALSDALALARTHSVVMTGPLADRVAAINAGAYPFEDPGLADYLKRWPLDLRATVNPAEALRDAEMVLIASPLPHCPQTGGFLTAELDAAIAAAVAQCPGVPVVIRSAVPVGHTCRIRARLNAEALFYAPEFRRESHALTDTLHPAQIVVGARGEAGRAIATVLRDAALSDVPVRCIGEAEAEAVKHFSQAYLAARVAYFNELDSYAMMHDLDARQVIDGVCLDPRIGGGANNPCFGFGGQRLPRSTEHLTDTFGKASGARVLPRLAEANAARMDVLVAKVAARGAARIGVYRPGGPAEFDTLAELTKRIASTGTRIETFDGPEGSPAFERFTADCDLVLSQRMSPALAAISDKLFCRDHYMT
ncbi:MAG: UDP-glucose 6-dehydrogenase [Rhodobacter sp.]|uniref:UDP-glucose 6-dehydrogenase n=1 Tax=Pararhodobacter sp. TaxID=2127056 RepID=UPI001DA6AA72|nr:UDP-glucose 6-dehydrogenase [Pararhodobacter sp.]MCB1344793.1 UDP-glucose 6-dehydrogenase [Paracoccaceae bacterium]MCC0072647.1 UDP-glucose 6-dehydrogenase [Rhodobacter sp.]HPD93281.1 UDP-glucose 6-dehydrogenase [Pararhodobacter sp.]